MAGREVTKVYVVEGMEYTISDEEDVHNKLENDYYYFKQYVDKHDAADESVMETATDFDNSKLIHTAATEMLQGSDVGNYSRTPEIMADAAYAILTDDPKKVTGNFFIDDEVLKRNGVTDFDQYLCNKDSKTQLMPDLFVDEATSTVSAGVGGGSEKKETGSTSGTSQDDSKLGQLFSVIESSLNEELVSKTKAVYQFVVTGEENGKWYIDLKNGTGKCGQGEPPTKADATLTMNSNNFFAMFEGKLKSTSAYMTGKLKISGDLTKAMKLEKLMGKLKHKL